MSDESLPAQNTNLIRRLVDELFYGDGTGIDEIVIPDAEGNLVVHHELATDGMLAR